jgi:hypothetical protein
VVSIPVTISAPSIPTEASHSKIILNILLHGDINIGATSSKKTEQQGYATAYYCKKIISEVGCYMTK